VRRDDLGRQFLVATAEPRHVARLEAPAFEFFFGAFLDQKAVADQGEDHA
jgi:hypothetical protein